VELKVAPLSETAQRRIAEPLGVGALADHLAMLIACLIASHHEGRRLAKGHTPARVAAGLQRIENRMRLGHGGPEITREITDPHFRYDEETVIRLAPVVADPAVPRDRKLALIEARRREVETLPQINPRYALRVVLAAHALEQIWHHYAVDCSDTVRQWHFVLEILEAAGEGTEGMRRNAERLKRELGPLLELTSNQPQRTVANGPERF
jgi:hypothetical protein